MAALASAIRQFLHATPWRAVISRAMATVLLVACATPHLLAYPGSFRAQETLVINAADGGNFDPILPGGATHHCAQCACHSSARLALSVAAAPFAVWHTTYTARLYERPRSLAPTPIPPPPRA